MNLDPRIRTIPGRSPSLTRQALLAVEGKYGIPAGCPRKHGTVNVVGNEIDVVDNVARIRPVRISCMKCFNISREGVRYSLA